jgi:hypothetical protein
MLLKAINWEVNAIYLAALGGLVNNRDEERAKQIIRK